MKQVANCIMILILVLLTCILSANPAYAGDNEGLSPCAEVVQENELQDTERAISPQLNCRVYQNDIRGGCKDGTTFDFLAGTSTQNCNEAFKDAVGNLRTRCRDKGGVDLENSPPQSTGCDCFRDS